MTQLCLPVPAGAEDKDVERVSPRAWGDRPRGDGFPLPGDRLGGTLVQMPALAQSWELTCGKCHPRHPCAAHPALATRPGQGIPRKGIPRFHVVWKQITSHEAFKTEG